MWHTDVITANSIFPQKYQVSFQSTTRTVQLLGRTTSLPVPGSQPAKTQMGWMEDFQRALSSRGVTVASIPGKGRGLVTTRDFSPGMI